MAEDTQGNCPICRDTAGEMASVTPCLHLFCLGCIVRWAKKKPSCPLCRQTMHTIIYSVRSEEDFLEMVLQRPSDPVVAEQEEEEAEEEQLPAYVAGFPSELWAGLFQESSEILEPLLPWLNQELSVFFSGHWWQEALAQSAIVASLCHYGLNEEALVRELQPLLEDRTQAFVRQLIAVAADRCSDQILRQMGLLDSHRGEEQEDSPPASPGPSTARQRTSGPGPASSSSPAVSSAQEDTSMPEATLRGSPGCSPSPPVPAEQEQPQDEAAAVAGPSGQGYTRSPSAPGQDRDCLHAGRRRPQKRRASGPQDPPQPCKKPSRRQQKPPTLPSRKKK